VRARVSYSAIQERKNSQRCKGPMSHAILVVSLNSSASTYLYPNSYPWVTVREDSRAPFFGGEQD